MNLLTTLKGSLLESFFPAAWDLAQWDACVADNPGAIFDRQPKWHKDFSIRMADDVADFDVMLVMSWLWKFGAAAKPAASWL